MRHGVAEELKPGGRDADRPLTPDGKRRLRATLQVAKAAGMEPDAILTSPYKRARESAEIAAEVLHFRNELIPASALAPMADVRLAWDEIRSFKGASRILLSSHEPLCGLLVGFLLGVPALQMDVKKGAITRVDTDSFSVQPRGVLKWVLTPRLAGARRD